MGSVFGKSDRSVTDHSKHSGSLWTRWDLHVHAPTTKLADGFGVSDEAGWRKYVEILEASPVQVFGITDYFSFDSYLTVVEKYRKYVPDGTKVFFPNIEFRLTETVGSDGKCVNTHVLFSNDQKILDENILANFLNSLSTHITRNGVTIKCGALRTEVDFKKATVNLAELKSKLREFFGDEEKYIIITAANNDGLRGVDSKSARSISISDELDKASDGFFGNSKNTSYFLGSSRYEDGSISRAKPVFCGSDAHSFADLDRLSGDEPNYEPTWIKAKHTFRGLRQTLFEPEGRVYIGDTPPVLVRQDREATCFISELRVKRIDSYSGENGSWFEDMIIPFNPELTAIIGNKGSGKSAIADIVALLANSRQDAHFSFLTDDAKNRKFRRPGYAENFEGELIWRAGDSVKKRLNDEVDRSKTEAVRYLPQNYFESLTNEIEVNAFRQEIEEVVFSHVEREDRMGASSFRGLEELKTAQSKSDVSELKARLRELNIELVELEKRADPKYLQGLKETLKTKEAEYQALESSKPKAIEKPDIDNEDQRGVTEKIEAAAERLDELRKRGKSVSDNLSTLKLTLQKLTSISETVAALAERVEFEKSELTNRCADVGLDIEQIVKFGTELSGLNAKIKEVSDQISVLNTSTISKFESDLDFDSLVSLPDLRAAYEFVSAVIKELKEALSAPQKRYQNYLLAIGEISTKQAELKGDEADPKPDTIEFLREQISYIENKLIAKISEKREAQKKIASLIFDAKKKVRDFYERMKTSVEERLEVVSSEEFTVTIDASFVLQHSFFEEFFSFVNRNVRGKFRGIGEGERELNEMLSGVDWNDAGSIIEFVDSIVAFIQEYPVAPQVKDIKAFYDFLYSFEYFEARYELRLGGKNLNELSPGEKGLLLLVFYLHLDKDRIPLIIDQPEDNLDNDSIYSVLAKCIREAKKTRQVILVTHNPNLAVGADAEQILHVALEKPNNYKFTYQSGAIEEARISDSVIKILEGSRPAFVQRRLVYDIK